MATKTCRAAFDPSGVNIRCVRRSGHLPKHQSKPSEWVDASSEEPFPDLRGLYVMRWSKPSGESPEFMKVKA